MGRAFGEHERKLKLVAKILEPRDALIGIPVVPPLQQIDRLRERVERLSQALI